MLGDSGAQFGAELESVAVRDRGRNKDRQSLKRPPTPRRPSPASPTPAGKTGRCGCPAGPVPRGTPTDPGRVDRTKSLSLTANSPRRVEPGAVDGQLRWRRRFAGQLHRHLHHRVRQPVSVAADDQGTGEETRNLFSRLRCRNSWRAVKAHPRAAEPGHSLDEPALLERRQVFRGGLRGLPQARPMEPRGGEHAVWCSSQSRAMNSSGWRPRCRSPRGPTPGNRSG